MQQSPIFIRTYDLLKWLIPATTKFPKPYHFALSAKLQQMSYGLQEALIAAAYQEHPMAQLRKADMRLSALRVYIRLASDFGVLSERQYLHVSKMLDEIGRLLGGWMRQNQKQ